MKKVLVYLDLDSYNKLLEIQDITLEFQPNIFKNAISLYYDVVKGGKPKTKKIYGEKTNEVKTK